MDKFGNIRFHNLILILAFVLFMHRCEKEQADDDDISSIQFNPLISYDSITDWDGNTYKTVLIGQQVWMAENLRTTHTHDGIAVPRVIEHLSWSGLSTPGYCWYEYQEDHKEIWGALYNWYAIETERLCPAGWHVPAMTDWDTLITFLGGAETAGGRLKEIGNFHWQEPNTGATNESGFTALPSGARSASAGFFSIDYTGAWWSSTMYDTLFVYYVMIQNFHGTAQLFPCPRETGLSVRCVKD
jgi:uncharacterized protein (TIGR02145 family)